MHGNVHIGAAVGANGSNYLFSWISCSLHDDTVGEYAAPHCLIRKTVYKSYITHNIAVSL